VRLGDRVIQLNNDYEIGVFNGDVGVVDNIARNGSFVAKFQIGQRGWVRVMYAPGDVGDLVALAYCLTVHKAQGNEYPVVVMPVVPEASFMLTRPLLYTAISRAKQLLVLVGSRRHLHAGVLRTTNGGAKDRVTGLVQRLDHALLGVQDDAADKAHHDRWEATPHSPFAGGGGIFAEAPSGLAATSMMPVP